MCLGSESLDGIDVDETRSVPLRTIQPATESVEQRTERAAAATGRPLSHAVGVDFCDGGDCPRKIVGQRVEGSPVKAVAQGPRISSADPFENGPMVGKHLMGSADVTDGWRRHDRTDRRRRELLEHRHLLRHAGGSTRSSRQAQHDVGSVVEPNAPHRIVRPGRRQVLQTRSRPLRTFRFEERPSDRLAGVRLVVVDPLGHAPSLAMCTPVPTPRGRGRQS
jgi:hypothetical protein